MGRARTKPLSVDERMKQNYISDLNAFGVTTGPNNKPLQSLSNAELCRLVTKESLKRD